MAEDCCCQACNLKAGKSGEKENIKEEVLEGHTISVFYIAGLDCADCAAKLEKKIDGIEGVFQAALNFGAAKLTVQHAITENVIVKAIEEAGYKVQIKENSVSSNARETDWKLISTVFSGVLFGGAMLLDYFLGYSVAFVYILAIAAGGWHTFRSAYYSVKSLSFDMNFLMSIAVLGAGVLGEWSEAAAVVFLFSFGNLLEAHTLGKTRKSLEALVKLSPRQALVRREGEEIRLKVEEICLGDLVIVKPGEMIAMDGVVANGHSSVNQAAVTGESVPVEKQSGDEVYAGTMNQEGSMEIQVTKLAADSTIARIIQLVEEAQAQKAPAEQLVNRFAKYYTPVVLVLAAGVMLIPWLFFGQPFREWFYMALVLLVISCPCALVLSTPVSIVSAIGSASRQGILIKGGAYLEEMGSITTMAFDKTGTLTQGNMAVTDIVPQSGMEKADLLLLAASLENLSEHPVAKAIGKEASGLELKRPEEFKALPGLGVRGKFEDKMFFAGNRRLFTELGYEMKESLAMLSDLENQGKTVMLIGSEKVICGFIALADTLRDSSALAVNRLRQAGIQNIVMLSGDHLAAAETIGQKLGLDKTYGELMPADKVAVIKELKTSHGKTAMVGDGINDAPALAMADIGIAMGAAGSDAALEAADIALMVNDLTKLSYVVALSRKTLRIIKQNIGFSVCIKALFLILTFMGLANLWLAVFADTGAAVLVTLNGMRLAGKI